MKLTIEIDDEFIQDVKATSGIDIMEETKQLIRFHLNNDLPKLVDMCNDNSLTTPTGLYYRYKDSNFVKDSGMKINFEKTTYIRLSEGKIKLSDSGQILRKI